MDDIQFTETQTKITRDIIHSSILHMISDLLEGETQACFLRLLWPLYQMDPRRYRDLEWIGRGVYSGYFPPPSHQLQKLNANEIKHLHMICKVGKKKNG